MERRSACPSLITKTYLIDSRNKDLVVDLRVIVKRVLMMPELERHGDTLLLIVDFLVLDLPLFVWL